MNFIEWLFVKHWLFSTITMPFPAMLYAIFTEQIAWAWCAFVWWAIRAVFLRFVL